MKVDTVLFSLPTGYQTFAVSIPHLLILSSFRHGPILLCLLEKDLLHLSVLQVIQLSDGILCPCNQVHDHCQRALSAQKSMLPKRKA